MTGWGKDTMSATGCVASHIVRLRIMYKSNESIDAASVWLSVTSYQASYIITMMCTGLRYIRGSQLGILP